MKKHFLPLAAFGFTMFTHEARAVADGYYCVIEETHSLPSAKKQVIYFEDVSKNEVLVAYYGRQVMRLPRKTRNGFELTHQNSKFFFKLDADRGRVVVAPKELGTLEPTSSEKSQWHAGNCRAI